MNADAQTAETIASAVVDAGLKVHRALGPGLLESAYEYCLAQELRGRGLEVLQQVVMPHRISDEFQCPAIQTGG